MIKLQSMSIDPKRLLIATNLERPIWCDFNNFKWTTPPRSELAREKLESRIEKKNLVPYPEISRKDVMVMPLL